MKYNLDTGMPEEKKLIFCEKCKYRHMYDQCIKRNLKTTEQKITPLRIEPPIYSYNCYDLNKDNNCPEFELHYLEKTILEFKNFIQRILYDKLLS